MVQEELEGTRNLNGLYGKQRRIVEGQIANLDEIVIVYGSIHDAKDEIDILEGLVSSIGEDLANFDSYMEKVISLKEILKGRIGEDNVQNIVGVLLERSELKLELAIMPKAVTEDTSYCPVEWGQTYKQTQEYGSSIGIDIPSGQVFVPIEDAEHSGFVFSNNDDPEVYLRPDASSQTISHELFHKGHKNKPDMSETERLIYQEGLAEWFGFKVNEEEGNSKIEGFLYYTNNDIYHDHLMDELESQAPYRLGLMLFNDIESQYGTEKVVEIANKYKSPGLKPLLDLMSSETRKVFDHAFSVVYDKIEIAN